MVTVLKSVPDSPKPPKDNNVKEKSEMELWAEKEIELYRETMKAKYEDDGCWEYDCACMESALKAFKVLCKDRHSGASMMVTKDILNRLICNVTLTQIKDTPDIWEEIENDDGYILYQCNRLPSLFKHVWWSHGKIEYRDVNRAYGIDLNDIDAGGYHSGLLDRVVNELYPITMPYYPSTHRYEVFTETFLVDPKNGDFDTRGIIYLISPGGTRVDVNRYFKDAPEGWEEIDFNEYEERKSASKITEVLLSGDEV